MAAVLRQEFSFDNMDIAIDRGGGGGSVIFPDDRDYIPTIRKAFQYSFNTNYPTSFLSKKLPPVNSRDRSGWVSVDWGGK